MISALLASVLLFPAVQAGQPAPASTRTPDPVAVSRARSAADSFVRLWRFYWESSEGLRGQRGETWPPPPGLRALAFSQAESLAYAARYATEVTWNPDRMPFLHCHTDADSHIRPIGFTSVPGSRSTYSYSIIPIGEYRIDGHEGKHAICPTWFPLQEPLPWDERLGIDVAVIPELWPRLRSARANLLSLLDSVAQLAPADQWVVGQRVRFALDQGDTARAASAAASCRSVEWWCLMLDGYVRAARRESIDSLDMQFQRALAAMPPPVRCEWSDLSVLLDETGRQEYGRMSCAEREAANERIWWLADPSYLEPGNERRVEHYSRLMLVRLRSETELNERWDMRDERGGRAVKDMLIRYGWPSFTWWAGAATDRGHHDYLGQRDARAMDHGRFATAEYGAPRVHTVPAWGAVADPFTATGAEWEVWYSEGHRKALADTVWWPREHFPRAGGGMVQLRQQVGMFRRDSAVLLAMSSSLYPSQLAGPAGDTLFGAMVFSRGPGSVVAEPRAGLLGYTTVFRAMVGSIPQVVSLELFGKPPRRVLTRSRFGITPPPSLSMMSEGSVAISDPVLIHLLDDEEVPPVDAEAALTRMIGSTTLRDPRRIALYWETYGIAVDDTIAVSIRIERKDEPPSALRRLGLRLGLAQRTDMGITFGWSEPQQSRIVANVPGRIPIQGRSMLVNVAELEAGDYFLYVAVQRPGGEAVIGVRELTVMR